MLLFLRQARRFYLGLLKLEAPGKKAAAAAGGKVMEIGVEEAVEEGKKEEEVDLLPSQALPLNKGFFFQQKFSPIPAAFQNVRVVPKGVFYSCFVLNGQGVLHLGQDLQHYPVMYGNERSSVIEP